MLMHMVRIAEEAGRLVLAAYARSDVSVEYKGPNDPVTEVDRAVNAFILSELLQLYPDVPVVAEESDPSCYADFEKAGRAFFVDPIDGTREFIERTSQFAVMMGYAEAGRPVLGVVVRPTPWCVYAGGNREGGHGQAYVHQKNDATGVMETQKLQVRSETILGNASTVVSRSRSGGRIRTTLEALKTRELIPLGSAGLKVLAVAEGAADLYVHPGEAGKAWDYCGPEAIVRAAGGILLRGDGTELSYLDADPLKGLGVVCGNQTLVEQALAVLHSGAPQALRVPV
jgi:3'(2'), 5'-bisphosphate nucleotidase